MSQQNLSRRRGAMGGIPVAYLAIWAAIIAVSAILPAIPLVGGGTFGGQEFILALPGLLFGPLGGLVAASVGSLIASLIAPATAYFGLLTFYVAAIAAAVAGLLMQNTGRSRLWVLIIYVVGAIAWPLIPAISSIGAYVYAKGAYWPMHATALLGLWASPWAVKQIRTYEATPVALGVAVISWTSYMVNHLWLSIGYSYLYPEGPDQWVFAFMSGIVPGQRIVLTLVSVVIGSALIIGLHRAGVRFGEDSGSALSETEEEFDDVV